MARPEELLDLFNKDIDDLCGMIRKEDMQFYEIVAEYQITFILIHEFSHIYYYANPEVLEENRRIRKDNLIWLRKQLDTDKPLLARMLHFFIPSMRYAQEHSFDEAIASLELQEELLCDDAAWHMTSSFASIEYHGFRTECPAECVHCLYLILYRGATDIGEHIHDR